MQDGRSCPAGLQERAGVKARGRARKNAFASKVVLQIEITNRRFHAVIVKVANAACIIVK